MTLFATDFIWYDLIRDIVSLIMGCVTLWIAYQGLKTWEKETTWKSYYNLAHKLLHATYQLRSAFDTVRNEMIFVSEFQEASPHMNEEELVNNRTKALQAVYRKRRGVVLKAHQELDVILLEAEVTFGRRIYDLFDQLFAKKNILLVHINKLVDDSSSQGSNKFPDHDIIYAQDIRRGDDGNWFSEEIQDIIVQIEDILRPYLTK